jgi:hypothetical protein
MALLSYCLICRYLQQNGRYLVSVLSIVHLVSVLSIVPVQSYTMLIVFLFFQLDFLVKIIDEGLLIKQ